MSMEELDELPPKHLIFNWFWEQKHLEKEYTAWYKFRDFHNGNYFTKENPDGAGGHSWKIFIILAKLASESVPNCTVIANSDKDKGKYPSFLAWDALFDKPFNDFNWAQYYKPFKLDLLKYSVSNPISGLIHRQQETVAYLHSELKWDLNFVYCAPLKTETASVLDFTYVLNPFDAFIWFGIIFSVIFVSFARFQRVKSTISFLDVLFPTISGFLSPSGGIAKVGGNLTNPSNSSKAFEFIFWLFACTTILTFYSGELTGNIVKPPPEAVMQSVEELEENNYRLRATNDTLTVLQNNFGEMATGNGSSHYISPTFQLIHKLLIKEWKKGFLGSEFGSVENFRSFINSMIGGELQMATIMWAHDSFSRAMFINDLISERYSNIPTLQGGNITKDISLKYKHNKCYVGEKVIPGGVSFTGATPPKAQFVTRGVLRLMQAGIVTRWMSEFYEMHRSERVQDRMRVITTTDVKQRDDAGVSGKGLMKALKLEGRTVAIFTLWGCCCLICVVSFVFERFRSRRTKVEEFKNELF